MDDVQIDVNKIIESLSTQIAQQAQRIAVLEASVGSLKEALAMARAAVGTLESATKQN
jgi:hypothetical protein